MNQIIAQLTELFLQYSIKQRMIIATILIGFISAVVVLVLWANRTEYDLLYSNLEPGAAGSIVADLRNSKVPYKLENGGTTIYAPSESVSELRLRYAQTGYIKDAVTGYELFENNNLGMTTFMQKINFKRALEGELMRTINQFPEVKQCRVHLVIPEDKLFEGDKKGSASVVLHLQAGAMMNQNQVKGVAALVANSVNGIDIENVVVVDDDGNVLIEGKEDDTLLTGVGNQLELQQALENKLQKKVLALVLGVVGRDNAVVKVSAELNFDRIERISEEVDPETSALISEDTYTEQDTGTFTAQKTVRNYEFSKTHETFIANSGNIKRLTVAVLVNGSYQTQEDAEGEITQIYNLRSEEDLNQLATLVRSAVGYNEDRGDIVDVQNMQLAKKPEIRQDPGFLENTVPFNMWDKLISYGLMLIGLFLAYTLLKGMLKTSFSQLELPGGKGVTPALAGATGSKGSLARADVPEEIEVSEDLYMKKLSPEARAKMKASDKMTSEVVKFAEESPENTTKLLRSWIAKAGAA